MGRVIWKNNYIVGLVTGWDLEGSSAIGIFISKYTKIQVRKNEGKYGEGLRSWYDKRE